MVARFRGAPASMTADALRREIRALPARPHRAIVPTPPDKSPSHTPLVGERHARPTSPFPLLRHRRQCPPSRVALRRGADPSGATVAAGRPPARRTARRLRRSAALRRSRRRDDRTGQIASSSIRSAAASRRSTSGRCASAARSRWRPGRRLDRHRHRPAHHARSCGLRQWRRVPLLRPERRLCRRAFPVIRATISRPVSRSPRPSGRAPPELVTAIALAYEVNCRLIDAFDLTARGWDPPVFSLPAVALAAGKLMKLPPDRLAQAVSLALNDHIPMGQTRSQSAVRLEGARRCRSRAQRGLRRHAGARRHHRPGAHLRGTEGLLPAGLGAGRGGRRGLRPAAASRSASTNAA